MAKRRVLPSLPPLDKATIESWLAQPEREPSDPEPTGRLLTAAQYAIRYPGVGKGRVTRLVTLGVMTGHRVRPTRPDIDGNPAPDRIDTLVMDTPANLAVARDPWGDGRRARLLRQESETAYHRHLAQELLRPFIERLWRVEDYTYTVHGQQYFNCAGLFPLGALMDAGELNPRFVPFVETRLKEGIAELLASQKKGAAGLGPGPGQAPALPDTEVVFERKHGAYHVATPPVLLSGENVFAVFRYKRMYRITWLPAAKAHLTRLGPNQWVQAPISQVHPSNPSKP